MKTTIKKLDQNPIQNYFRQENLLKGFFSESKAFHISRKDPVN